MTHAGGSSDQTPPQDTEIPEAAAVDTAEVDAAEEVTPAQALARLRRGNARWVSGDVLHPHQSIARREAVASGQDPFAVTFSCIDSRVPPELVFDLGLGDLFVVRTAAHTMDDLVEASVQYGPMEMGTPLVVVMGHQRCGAVTAAVRSIESGETLPGHLQEIVEAIRPAYTEGSDEAETIDRTIRAHTRLTVARLNEDEEFSRLIDSGDLAIRGAYYSLDSGVVSWLG